jgi:hypothetical protein
LPELAAYLKSRSTVYSYYQPGSIIGLKRADFIRWGSMFPAHEFSGFQETESSLQQTALSGYEAIDADEDELAIWR